MGTTKQLMEVCEACDGAGHVERIAHYGNAGWYAARAARTGDEGPCFEDCECEECNGEGEVAIKCPRCGEPIEEELCEHCEACARCCACTTCASCGAKVPDGERWDKAPGSDDKLCEQCIEEQHGPWCWEQERACDSCPLDEACDGCARRAAKLERAQEAAEAAALG